MASFDKAQAYVKIAEGKYQNDYSDAGNWTGGAIGSGSQIGTNYGIAAFTLSSWLGRTATKSDMQNLTYETALKIYKKEYWDAIGGDDIENQSVATMIYDGGVNQGVYAIAPMVSKVLGITATIPFSKTVTDAINNYVTQKDFFDKIAASRISRYTAGGYGSAWINRVKNIIWQETKKGTEQIVTTAKKNPVMAIIFGVTLVGLTLAIIYRKNMVNYFNQA